MKESLISELEEMTVEERINFVSDVWDTIAEIPENVQIPEWHKRELEKRLTESQAKVSPWIEVKKRVLS